MDYKGQRKSDREKEEMKRQKIETSLGGIRKEWTTGLVKRRRGWKPTLG